MKRSLGEDSTRKTEMATILEIDSTIHLGVATSWLEKTHHPTCI